MENNDIIRFVSDGFDRAKGGLAAEVYSEVTLRCDRQTLPLKSHYPFGWIIYYALHQSKMRAIKERKQMLARYLRLEVEKPHKLHSMILTEALRLYKDAAEAAFPGVSKSAFEMVTDATRFSIVKFAEIWGLDNLRPGDWRRKEHEGKMLPSTVEQLITHYVDELYVARIPSDASFRSIMDRAIVEYPDSANLHAQYARVCELDGDLDKAIYMLRKAILLSSSKFYLWSRLAEIVKIKDKENLKLRVSLLYRALGCSGKEEFKGKIRIALAEVLSEGGAYPQAKWELKKVRALYECKGWNLPRLYKEVAKRIPAGTIDSDPDAIYRNTAHLADAYIYDSLPYVSVRKTYHKPAQETTDRYGNRRPGQTAWRVTDDNGANYWFSPSRFSIPDNLPGGTPLLVKIFGGKVVQATMATDRSAT